MTITSTAQTLKECREYNKFTTGQVAQFLGIGRSAYANYEAGIRETPLEVLEKCAHLYGCELSLFFEENARSEADLLACAFRVENATTSDLKEIALFKNIVINYLKMNQLIENKENY